jgi:hypothetical protein
MFIQDVWGQQNYEISYQLSSAWKKRIGETKEKMERSVTEVMYSIT